MIFKMSYTYMLLPHVTTEDKGQQVQSDNPVLGFGYVNFPESQCAYGKIKKNIDFHAETNTQDTDLRHMSASVRSKKG